MFSCCHFSDFLSDPIGSESRAPCQKRGQEATSSEGPPMVKPKPTIPAKARPLSLVARNPRSEKNSSQNVVYLVKPGIADERKEVELAFSNSWRNASKSDKELPVPTKEVGTYKQATQLSRRKHTKHMCSYGECSCLRR